MSIFFNITKTVIKIFLIILVVCFTAIFIIIPFLYNCIDQVTAQWLWYPSCFILLSLLFIGSRKDISFENQILDKIGSVGVLWVAPLIPSIFVFNYYNIDHIWHWVIFSYFFFLIPFSFYNLLAIGVSQNTESEEKKQVIALNMIKYTALYWLFDLFYMSIFNDWLIFKFVFGILAILLISFNLIDVFLHGIKSIRFFFTLELIFGLGLSGYLIFIIPNEKLQTIVLAIVSALMGGIFTLLGVAWTIKKGDDDRKADLHQMEEDRKEEERKKLIPYIRISHDEKSLVNATVKKIKEKDVWNKESNLNFVNNRFFSLYRIVFSIKNISTNNIILMGVFIDNDYFDFDKYALIEPNSVCKIEIGDKSTLTLFDEIKSIKLKISDILEYVYNVNCDFEYKGSSHFIEIETKNQKSFSTEIKHLIIKNVTLPKIEEKDIKKNCSHGRKES